MGSESKKRDDFCHGEGSGAARTAGEESKLGGRWIHCRSEKKERQDQRDPEGEPSALDVNGLSGLTWIAVDWQPQ